MRLAVLSVVVLLLAAAPLFAQAAPEPGVSLTVYNNDLGVVKDTRQLTIGQPVTELRFSDVARRIDPTSVHFKSLTDPNNTTVIEQNYEFDLVSADKLLDKYVDRMISVITDDGSKYSGRLLSYDNAQIVLQGNDQLYMIQRPDNVRNIEFSKLPEGLLTRPTLVWRIKTAAPGEHLAQVTYQTSGMGWAADYNAIINDDDTRLDLNGWVTLTNQSGAAYRDAEVKLIAGDVRTIQEQRPQPTMRREAVMLAEADAAAGFEQKAFFEYHMYTLGRKTTVNENQIKQIELLTAANVPVTKRYVFEPGGRYWHRRYGDKNEYKVNVFVEFRNDKDFFEYHMYTLGRKTTVNENQIKQIELLTAANVPVTKRYVFEPGGRYWHRRYGDKNEYKVNVFVEFRNDKESNLGMPLPKGKIRVYKRDGDDLEFIGEDRIDHTPKDEQMKVYVGDAFDIVGEKTIKEQKQGQRWRQQKIEIELRNHKDTPVTIRVREHMGHGNWTLSETSHAHTKPEHNIAEFDVVVDANGETTLKYTVDYRW